MLVGRPDTVIVIASELASFYRFVKGRQEADSGHLVVLLDQRHGERRHTSGEVQSDRRRGDRRAPGHAARALLAVLGFAILHRQGEQHTA